MRIVVAPDGFKGCLDARGVARALGRGLEVGLGRVLLDLVPVADGGEGTVTALVEATAGTLHEAEVTGPLGEPVRAVWGELGADAGEGPRTAVIEMAAASGLPRVAPDRLDPLGATSYGTGELVRVAVEAGCRRVILGLGGSATTDGGTGLAQALGIRLLDAEGEEIGRGGGALGRLAAIDVAGRVLDPGDVEVVGARDVDSPLHGPAGAAAVYGPQKGATPEQVALLDGHLAHLARVVGRDLGVEVDALPGGGAAGGLGAGLVAFLGARLEPGVERVLAAARFDDRLRGADLVVTGEGRLDLQTRRDKAPWGVARAAARRGVPVVAVAGSVVEEAYALHEDERDGGFDAILGITPRPMTLDEARAQAPELLRRAGEELGRVLGLRFDLWPRAD